MKKGKHKTMASKYVNKKRLKCSRCNEKFYNVAKNSKFTK